MKEVIGAVSIFLGIFVILTPHLILPVCEYHGFQKMACSYTGLAEIFTGVMIIFISTGIIFSKTREGAIWLSLILFVSGLSVILIPEVIGYCASSRMPCNYGTVPALRFEGIIISILASVNFIMSLKRRNP